MDAAEQGQDASADLSYKSSTLISPLEVHGLAVRVVLIIGRAERFQRGKHPRIPAGAGDARIESYPGCLAC